MLSKSTDSKMTSQSYNENIMSLRRKMKQKSQKNKSPYQTPNLEQHANYNLLMGLSIPFNAINSSDFLLEESFSLEGDQ
jgi:hypothetical protein